MLIAVAFVFALVMIGAGVWLVLNSTGSDDVADGDRSPPATDIASTATASTPTETSSPPATTAPTETETGTEAETDDATPDVTTATTAPDTTGVPDRPPGDLGLTAAILDVECDGGYITFVGSAVGNQPYPDVVSSLLQAYPGSAYLSTKSCPSLRQEFVDGSEIYGVVFGPFATQAEACAARSDGPGDAYVRRLSTTDPQDHTVDC